MLPALYDAEDPYVVKEGPTQPPFQSGLSSISLRALTTESQIHQPHGQWEPIGNKEQCGKESLLAFLSKRIGMDEGATEGAVRLLDGKGLASAGPNLQRSDCKVFHWRESTHGYLTPSVSSSTNATIPLPLSMVKLTPLEASRTKFGEDFLRFCRIA